VSVTVEATIKCMRERDWGGKKDGIKEREETLDNNYDECS